MSIELLPNLMCAEKTHDLTRNPSEGPLYPFLVNFELHIRAGFCGICLGSGVKGAIINPSQCIRAWLMQPVIRSCECHPRA